MYLTSNIAINLFDETSIFQLKDPTIFCKQISYHSLELSNKGNGGIATCFTWARPLSVPFLFRASGFSQSQPSRLG